MSNVSTPDDGAHVMPVRALSAAIASIVVVDAIVVGAPFLAIVAVPFVVGAVALRHDGGLAEGALAAWSVLYVVVGVNYAVANGFDAPWADLLFAYVGTPLAAAIVVHFVRSFLSHRAHPTTT